MSKRWEDRFFLLMFASLLLGILMVFFVHPVLGIVVALGGGFFFMFLSVMTGILRTLSASEHIGTTHRNSSEPWHGPGSQPSDGGWGWGGGGGDSGGVGGDSGGGGSGDSGGGSSC